MPRPSMSAQWKLLNDGKPRKFKVEIRVVLVQKIELDHKDLIELYENVLESDDLTPLDASKVRRELDATFFQLCERNTPIILDRGTFIEDISAHEFFDHWWEETQEALEKSYKKLRSLVNTVFRGE